MEVVLGPWRSAGCRSPFAACFEITGLTDLFELE